MKIKHLHDWDLPYNQARSIQTSLAKRVRFKGLKDDIRTIAGLDCVFSKDNKRICTAIVVLSLADMKIIETQHASAKVTFPYIPGLLSFREAPVCIKAAEKLKTIPDVFVIDGQGIAHQRRLGLACHLGLFLDKPTIGCAKSRLIGRYEDVDLKKSSYSWLRDKDEIIGAVVRTRERVKPVFVSVGHKSLLEDAIELILACVTKYRLPEPTRLAHQVVSKFRLRI